MFKVSLLHYYKCRFGPLLFILFEPAITTRYVLQYCKELTRTMCKLQRWVQIRDLFSAKKGEGALATLKYFLTV